MKPEKNEHQHQYLKKKRIYNLDFFFIFFFTIEGLVKRIFFMAFCSTEIPQATGQSNYFNNIQISKSEVG